MRRSLLLALLAGVLLAALPVAAADAARGSCLVGIPGPECVVWNAKVRSVNDGDTMDVDVLRDGTSATRRIRMTGIQAMEQSVYSARRRAGDCHAVEATNRLEALVRRSKGKVRLAAQDPESTSQSQRRSVRTVAVKLNGRWRDAGTILMHEGLALWWPGRTEWAVNGVYSVEQQRAIAGQRGLFDPDACGVGPSAASPLKLWANWDADGDDNANPEGEWVKVRNLDPVNPVPLGDWYLRDAGMRRYVFPPQAVAPPGGTITVDVGTAGDDATVFPWGLRSPVFSNARHDEIAMGDGAYLFDPLGNVRATTVFPCRWQCSDPLQGAVALSVDPNGRRESVTLTNVAAGPIDLDGYVLKSEPKSYHFAPGSVLPPGGSMRVQVVGDPAGDTALEKGWGLEQPILRDAGDLVKLLTYTDLTLACAAWGDKTC
ncbi:MAG TPA: lamin tail domain-containing protein [Solirubrobacteraceae bacterium]|nr:lamin tail domain-containing protein [Solirubrobacteraceae bacterium]